MVIPNHTQIPNEFLDEEVSKLSGAAVKCFVTICRKTLGWHKVSDYISYSQLMQKTGLVSQSVKEALDELEAAGLVVVHRETGKTNLIDIRYTCPESREVKTDTSLKSREHLSKKQRGTSLKSRETKETIKETLQNKYIQSILPLLTVWNSLNLQKHSLETVGRNIKKRHADRVSEYGEEAVAKAIRNYAEIVNSDDYYFSYRWSLWDFLARGVEKFVDEVRPHDNYRNGPKKSDKYDQMMRALRVS